LNYLSKINTRVFIYPVRRLQKYLLGDLYYSYRLARGVKKKKYDKIHIIPLAGRFPLFLYLFFNKKKIILTLHEVTSHEAKTSFLETINLKWLINNSIPIIFHSNTTKNRFINFQKKFRKNKELKNNLEMIRFGLYETYTCFADQNPSSKKNGISNILFLGRIVPYKGIHILTEAIKLLQDKYNVHLVVAGKGEPYFNFNGIKSYDFINRSVSNEEIVKLIEECDMVVLPYTSASQSGLPMTVYPFHKPIVATNVDGLSEVIEHLKTGILVDNLSGKSLADSIEKLLVDKKLNKQIVENIKNKYNKGEYSWSFIADKTINFYQKNF
jgi:glycosyltransferase involved in cell wall biosynthesis